MRRAPGSANPARDAAFEATVMNPVPDGGSLNASAMGDASKAVPWERRGAEGNIEHQRHGQRRERMLVQYLPRPAR